MQFTAPVYAHFAAFLAYAVFAFVLKLRGGKSWVATSYVLAVGLTAAWAGVFGLFRAVGLQEAVPDFLAALRDGGWYLTVLSILYIDGRDRTLWRLVTTITVAVVALNAIFVLGRVSAGTLLGLRLDSSVSGLIALGLGFFLVENLIRNPDQDRRWSTKHLGIGLSAVLLFQGLELVLDLLTHRIPGGIIVARPLLYILVMPLFVVSAVRSPGLQLRVHSSRKIVFHTTTVTAMGVVLQGAAIAAYYLRAKGGDNGTALAIILGFAAIVGLAAVLASRTVRSCIIGFINENFFNYKYDYRLEWQSFIRAVSQWQDDNVPLGVLRTLAELLDSPGGALWVWRERWDRFMPVARWSLDSELAPVAVSDSCLGALADETCTIIDLTARDGESLDIWRQRFPGAWVIIPLRHRSALAGFALINHPRSERKLHWEDKNLVSLVALQLAAYLVQEETAQALADARQLEQFNKRFAFILHDTKNAIGQLKLLVRNVEQYGHDEEFRRDMVATLKNSVEKLQGLLASLTIPTVAPTENEGAAAVVDIVDMSDLASEYVLEKRKLGFEVVFGNKAAGPTTARLSDKRAFLGVLEHVVTNALEASSGSTPVTIQVLVSGDFVCVSVEDKGPGMTEQFIADELFRPLRSTKRTGFGIGAYQAREIMRDLGGHIEVRSRVGEGTTVALTVPIFISERELMRA